MNEQEIEIWKDIPDYAFLYQASNLGRIKSKWFNKEKILKPIINSNGYLLVNLYKDGIKRVIAVHRLVWEAFNHKTDLYIDHIVEGNRQDNRLCNLQAITQRENASKYHLTTKKSSKYIGVTWCKKNNKWLSQITINNKCKNLGYFTDEIEAANAYQTKLKELS